MSKGPGLKLAALGGFVGTTILAARYVFDRALNHDVAGFLLDARAFEMGRRLFVSFFEINAPSNVWLPVLSLKIAHRVPWTLADVHQGLLFLFVVGCAAFTVVLVWQRLGPGQPVTSLVASVLIPAMTVWFPSPDFGQREHLFLAAMGPFVVIVAGRHWGVLPSRATAIAAATLAAFGASSKPHFMLVAGVFVFADFCLRHGRLRQTGTESFALAAFLAAYVAWIAIVHPLYFTDMLPTATATYFTMRPPLATVVQVLGGKRITGAVGLALTLMAIVACWRPSTQFSRSAAIPALWCVLLLLSAAVYFGQSFGFQYHRIVLVALLLLGSGMALAALADRATETVFRPLSWRRDPGVSILLAVVCLGCSALLVEMIAESQASSATRREALADPMTRLMTGLPPGTPILMLETGIAPLSPLHAYADIRWTGEFSTLLVLRAIYDERDKAAAESRPIGSRMAKVEHDVRRFVLESFLGVAPEVVFVDISRPMTWFDDYPKPVSLIGFFSERPAFVAEWQKYEKIEEIRSLGGAEIAVYRRRKEAP